MNFDLLAKLNIIYYKSVTFFKKIKIVHIFLCLYLKYMCFAGIPSLKTVGDGLECRFLGVYIKRCYRFSVRSARSTAVYFSSFGASLGFHATMKRAFADET